MRKASVPEDPVQSRPRPSEKGGGWKEAQKVEAGLVELEVSWKLKHKPDPVEPAAPALRALRATEPRSDESPAQEEQAPEGPSSSEAVQWELFVPSSESGVGAAADQAPLVSVLRSEDCDPQVCKAEPVYTPKVEHLLSELTAPLQVLHTVDPKEAELHGEQWLSSIRKEIGVIEQAVTRLSPEEVRQGGWLRRPNVKVVPSKLVFTVKPPASEGDSSALFKRKARLVACGNHAPSTGSDIYASGAAAEALRCFLVISSRKGWTVGALDITSAFLLTPIPVGEDFPIFALTPPRYLVKQGLAREGELWILTHAVYGLHESPKLWCDYRDAQLQGVRCVVDGEELRLLRGTLDPNWWRIVKVVDGQMVGILLVYVDDFLLAGSEAMIQAVAKAVQAIWKTSPLALATTESPLRFLGVDILVVGSGFTLSQQSYAEELLRLNGVPPTALGRIPCPRDLATLDVLPTDEPPTEETTRAAQRLTGELLWLSQRTRPDLAHTACVLASLSTRAPARAIRIAERTLAYVQRTKSAALTAEADDSGLVAYSDASFAPEGERSHTGWVVFLHGLPVCWRSARQPFVTLSTAESELVAALDAVVALQSTEAMLSDLAVVGLSKTLRVDSQSALAIAIGQGSWRTRHLRVRASYLREQYEAGHIVPEYVPGAEQAADLLTKAMP